jgi:N-acetyl-gamma-glutamyl-phosphate reductase
MKESAALAAALPGHVAVVDLSASFRLADPQAWAPTTGPATRVLDYGLPELPGARGRMAPRAGSRRRAVTPPRPSLALAPLLARGLAEPQDIVIVAASAPPAPGARRRRRCSRPR